MLYSTVRLPHKKAATKLPCVLATGTTVAKTLPQSRNSDAAITSSKIFKIHPTSVTELAEQPQRRPRDVHGDGAASHPYEGLPQGHGRGAPTGCAPGRQSCGLSIPYKRSDFW